MNPKSQIISEEAFMVLLRHLDIAVEEIVAALELAHGDLPPSSKVIAASELLDVVRSIVGTRIVDGPAYRKLNDAARTDPVIRQLIATKLRRHDAEDIA